MMEFFSHLLHGWAVREDSIFFLVLITSLAVIAVWQVANAIRFIVELKDPSTDSFRGFYPRFKEKLFKDNPRAPLTWAIVPVIFLLLLWGVQWRFTPSSDEDQKLGQTTLPKSETSNVSSRPKSPSAIKVNYGPKNP